MSKKNILLSLALVAMACSFLTSCEKKVQDNQRPKVNLIEPEEGAKLKIGNKHGVHFEMKLTDDVMLASYRIEIHNNFDGHNHTASKSLRHGDEKPFFFQKEYSLKGQREASIHHHDIVIPEGVAEGNYHLMVQVLDAAGNETTVARNVVLTEEGGDDHHHHDHE